MAEANTPTDSYVGMTPMMSEPVAMSIIVVTRTNLRPFLSAIRPKTMPPSGRMRKPTAASFDRLDVDGGTSTNDTVLLLASGASGVRPGREGFADLLTSLSLDLVLALRADSEGATKEVDIVVAGAATESDAVTAARTLAEDNLVKTALFGADPNWGRIAMAVGRSGAIVDPDAMTIDINGVRLFAAGTTAADRATVDLSGRAVAITVDLGAGGASTTVYTTDLSHAYVEENSAYSS